MVPKNKIVKEFGSEEKLISLKNHCNFLMILKYIKQRLYFKSLKEIVFYPNNINKIKLFLLLLLPEKITKRIINLT